MFIARSTPAYIVTYLVLMVPTYILPYVGSNSTLVNVFSAALGMGPTPQWWAHVWCLVMLIVLGWLRGGAVGKVFLPALPAVAAVFDMTPGLSVIPMIPTLLHLAAIFIGAAAKTVVADEARPQTVSVAELALVRKAKIVAGMATLLAVGGSILFATTLGRSATPLRQIDKSPVTTAPAPTNANAIPAVSTTPLPVQEKKAATESDSVQAVATPPKPQVRHMANPGQPHGKTATTSEKPEVRYIRLND